MNAIINIQKITKKYKNADFYALKEVDLTIQKNEIFGLLGPNGAGKTTLISMLCGLIEPTEGSFSIQNLQFKKNRKELLQLIGVVPQEYAIYPNLTAFENLEFFGAMNGLKKLDLKEKIHTELEELGLLPFKDKRLKTFSGGMKRRVNLIAGSMHNPSILFLDEPTVGVDVQSKLIIIDKLKKINQSGTTIIYTSHHMDEAQELCTQVAILDHGEIVTQGTPQELINSVEKASRLEEVYLNLTGKKLRDYV